MMYSGNGAMVSKIANTGIKILGVLWSLYMGCLGVMIDLGVYTASWKMFTSCVLISVFILFAYFDLKE